MNCKDMMFLIVWIIAIIAVVSNIVKNQNIQTLKEENNNLKEVIRYEENFNSNNNVNNVIYVDGV